MVFSSTVIQMCRMQPGPVISARVAVAPTGMLRRQGLPLRLGPSSLAAMPPLPGSPVGFSALTARLDSCRILVKDSSVMFVPFMAYAASVCAIHSYLCVSASVTDVVCFLNMRKSPSASEKADGDCGHAVMDQVKMALCDSPRPIGESLVGRVEACRSCFHNHSRRWVQSSRYAFFTPFQSPVP